MNPFENNDGQFTVLVNGEAQYSMWPHFAAVPRGWEVAYGPAGRTDCQQYVREHWTDMRPAGLRIQA
ncbi:MbtH-like protein [compost metagenome]